MSQWIETTRFTNILVWLGRMKLKKMRLKYSKRTHTHTYTNKSTDTRTRKKTLSHFVRCRNVYGCAYFVHL